MEWLLEAWWWWARARPVLLPASVLETVWWAQA
jgi:hypothetical protein